MYRLGLNFAAVEEEQQSWVSSCSVLLRSFNPLTASYQIPFLVRSSKVYCLFKKKTNVATALSWARSVQFTHSVSNIWRHIGEVEVYLHLFLTPAQVELNTTPQSLLFQGQGQMAPIEYETGRAAGTVWTFRRTDLLPMSWIEFYSHLNAKFLKQFSSVQDFRPKILRSFFFCFPPLLLLVKK